MVNILNPDFDQIKLLNNTTKFSDGTNPSLIERLVDSDCCEIPPLLYCRRPQRLLHRPPVRRRAEHRRHRAPAPPPATPSSLVSATKPYCGIPSTTTAATCSLATARTSCRNWRRSSRRSKPTTSNSRRKVSEFTI